MISPLLVALAALSFQDPVPPVPVPAEEGPVVQEAPAPPSLRVTYVANAGFIFECEGDKVLIDGLHRRFSDDYLSLPPELQAKAESAEPPFDGVRLVLVTHRHPDHMHSEALGRFMQASPETLLFGPPQVYSQLKEEFEGFESIAERCFSNKPVLGELREVRVGGRKLEYGTIKHSSYFRAQNFAYLFEVGGRLIFHSGDGDLDPAYLRAMKLPSREIDLALLPFWELTTPRGQHRVLDHIAPARILPMHIPPATAQRARRDILAADMLPPRTVLIEPLESVEF